MDRHTADTAETDTHVIRVTASYLGYAWLVALLAVGFVLGFSLAEPNHPLHDLMMAVSG